jgi:type I restriction enzyme S subunit
VNGRERLEKLLSTRTPLALPTGWDVIRFRFMFRESKERNGSEPVGDMLSVSGYRGVELKLYDREERKRADEDLENYRVVRPGQLAVNTMWLNHNGLGVSTYLGHVSPAYSVYHITKRLEPSYANHLLRSDLYRELFKSYLYGIRPNSFQIKDADFLSLPVVLPPMQQQKEIANFLDHEIALVDQLIQAKEKLSSSLAAKRNASIISALFEGVDRIEWNAAAQVFEFHFRETGWSELRLKHAVMFMTSGSRGWSDFLSSEGDLFIQSGNIGTNMNLDLSEVNRITRQEGAEADRTLVNAGDVLLCITGGRTGAVGYVGEMNERAHVNQHVCLLRARTETMMPKLLAHVLWSEFGQAQIGAMQYGMKQGLGFSEVGNIKLPVPPRSQQPEIVRRIEHALQMIDDARLRLTSSISKLLELRASLITAAVTGQINVKTWRKHGQTERGLDQLEAKAMA